MSSSPIQKPIAILSSGGMDSFLVWAFYAMLGVPTINVYVDVGQKYRRKERWAWSHLCHTIPGFMGESVQALSLGHLETPSGIIPNRNAHLILAAATIAPTIALGILHGEINSDKSPEFLAAMEGVLNISNRGQYWNGDQATPHRIDTPLAALTKTEAVADYLSAAYVHPEVLPHEIVRHALLSTISCYAADESFRHAELQHCGECPSCFKRWVALMNNDLPTNGFKRYPPRWAETQGILRKAIDGTYSPKRSAEINDAIKRASTGGTVDSLEGSAA